MLIENSITNDSLIPNDVSLAKAMGKNQIW